MKIHVTSLLSIASICTLASACARGPTKLNAATLSLIESFEGFVPSPKPDPVGYPTVGYGHKCTTKGCSEVHYHFPLSKPDAEKLLASDVQPFINCLHNYINKSVALNDNQFGALVSFTYNLGCGAVRTSTLLQRLNRGEDPNKVAASELPKWNKGGGKVLPGLVRRRAAEVKLFQTPSKVQAHPLC